MNNTPVQIVANNGKLGIVAPSFGTLVALDPVVKRIAVDCQREMLESCSGNSICVDSFYDIVVEMKAQQLVSNLDQKELLDFGLVDNMSVRQLFEAINSKLSKRG